MAIRTNAPMGCADCALRDLGSSRTTVVLDKLDAATPREELVRPIRQQPEYESFGAGRPP